HAADAVAKGSGGGTNFTRMPCRSGGRWSNWTRISTVTASLRRCRASTGDSGFIASRSLSDGFSVDYMPRLPQDRRGLLEVGLFHQQVIGVEGRESEDAHAGLGQWDDQ